MKETVDRFRARGEFTLERLFKKVSRDKFKKVSVERKLIKRNKPNKSIRN